MVVRTLDRARPLGQKNTSNKLAIGPMQDKLKRPVPPFIPASQRSFAFGRQLVENVIRVDTTLRVASRAAHSKSIELRAAERALHTGALLAGIFFDYKAAYYVLSFVAIPGLNFCHGA